MINLLLFGFWLSIGTILYTFIGYALAVTILARFRTKEHKQAEIYPRVALVIAAYNEADIIAAKIVNSQTINYPPDKLSIVVVEDGSNDGTDEIVNNIDTVHLIHSNMRLGKAAALARAVPILTDEILVFTDANTMLEPDSVKHLVRHFADPSVGGVAGEKQVVGGGEGLYWRYESYLKKCEGRIGSVMGASGELFALRREAWRPPADDVIIEDFKMSMQLILDGWRLVYEPAAISREEPLNLITADWERRVRNAAGGFQALSRLHQMLDPRGGLVAWQFFSHRFLRWAVTPFLLPTVYLLNLFLLARKFYRFIFVSQVFFYGIGFLGFLRLRGGRFKGRSNGEVSTAISYFLMANAAAIAGFWRYIRKNQPTQWRKIR